MASALMDVERKKKMLLDKGNEAVIALIEACEVSEWKKRILNNFIKELVTSIKTCTMGLGKVRLSLARERAIMKFHQMRLSDFPVIWNKVFEDLGITPCTQVSQQSANRLIFNEILVEEYPSTRSTHEPCARQTLSAVEDNAVRYACGYVTMQLKKHYTQKNDRKARQYVECLTNMSVEGDEDTYYDYTKNWIDSVNRGGLFEVNNDCFRFFREVEMKTQQHLPEHLKSGRTAEELFSLIASDDNVDSLWCVISIDIDTRDDSQELLYMMVKKWVTMRGFALASSWLQDYKNITARELSKKKALRKELREKKTAASNNIQASQP